MKGTLVQRATPLAHGAGRCGLDQARTAATRSAVLAAMLFLGSGQAHAVDGCKVLLCLAGNWSSISQCRPDVEEAFRQVARGRGWPTCNEGGTANVSNNQWLSQGTCPPMYSRFDETGAWAGCTYGGMISVRIKDAPWSDVFWSIGSGTSTRYYAPARAALGGNIDPTYDRDLAAQVPPVCSGGDVC